MMDTIPQNSITCMMCRGSIQYGEKNHHDYNRHLESHHGVLYHHNIFLSVNLLNAEYLKRILEEFERSGKQSDFTSKGGNFTDEVIDVEDEDATKNDMQNDVKVNLHNGGEKSVNKCKICDTEYPELVDMFKCVNRHKENESIRSDLDILREEKRRSKKRKRLTVENTSMSPNVLQIDYEGEGVRDERVEKRMKQQRKRTSERWKTTEETDAEIKNNDNTGAGEERINDLIAQIDGAIKEKEKLEDTMSQNPLTPSDPLKKITSPYSATSPKTIFRCQQAQCNFKTDMNIKLKHHMKKHKQEEPERISGTKSKSSLIEAVDMATALAGAIQTNVEKDVSKEPTLEEHCDSEDETMDEQDKSEEESGDEPGSDDGHNKSEVEDEEQDNTDEEAHDKSKSDLSLARSFDEIKNTSEIFQNCPKQLRRGSESDRTRFTLTLDSFPEGWFYRQTGSRPGDKEYLSPDFAIMRSRKAAIEYMRCMNIYDPEILNNL